MRQASAVRTRIPYVLLFCAIPISIHLAIVETSGFHLASGGNLGALFKVGIVTASALTHWAIYSGLLLTFALTLQSGREPIITAVTRRLHGPITADLASYTRWVTIAWCGFFAGQLAISLILFFCAPLVAWSFFVNILDIPLVVTMYAAEYLFRLHYLQDPPRHSLATILSMVADMRKSRNGAAGSL